MTWFIMKFDENTKHDIVIAETEKKEFAKEIVLGLMTRENSEKTIYAFTDIHPELVGKKP